jgi:toxin ParE1/3/4
VKVRWSRLAEADLHAQCEYIARDDPTLANRLGTEVFARVESLGAHPYRGRPGRADGTRELPLPGLPWIAVYTVEDEVVTVLRLLHGAQSWLPDESA